MSKLSSVTVPAEAIEMPSVAPDMPPKVPDRILEDIIRFAGRSSTIQIKSKEDYDAVVANFGNMAGWDIRHVPDLGHYCMVKVGCCRN